ncbi:O-antigen translocase [Rhizobium sp. 16-449-1b]|uniref:O-antigen translocase n=1 Tax=Rhizobium sp. 16-449-1b TaxID=2819989 RepID=UPI001ADB57B0|nr:O-antigen translocase [Rhizobium sp. 16-449-1b]MBO9197576.1 O-antigen translocase [Rhizobium sp. 16-449-1b]
MASSLNTAGRQSYTQILKSTVMIGGSSVVNIGFSVVRNKAMALMLGPEGVGLIGLYNATTDIVHSVAGFGLNASGVRQIAESAGSNDPERIARTATALRRISVALGLLGTLMMACLAGPIARWTFGDDQHATAMRLLSVVIAFQVMSGGQAALVQGMRDIASLAWLSMLGAFFSTVFSIPIIYLYGENGIVASLVCVAAATLMTSWWYSRKIEIIPCRLSLAELWAEAGGLFKLGFIFMVSGFLTFGSAYAIRIIVLDEAGIVAAGLYQAAWSLGGLYAGFILQAMGTDFYPRLTGVANDNEECNRLVNEQTQVSVLLAGPGLLATLTLAPVIMHVFYSPAFYSAVDLLRWICLGMMLRIVAWPIGFIILAKGAQRIFFWTEVAAAIVHVGLAWICVKSFGTVGAGVAFFGLYVWHSILIYWIARRYTGFRYSAINRILVMAYLPLSGLVFLSFQFLPLWLASSIGLVSTAATGLYSLKTLAELLPPEALPRVIRTRFGRAAMSWSGSVRQVP